MYVPFLVDILWNQILTESQEVYKKLLTKVILSNVENEMSYI